MNMRALIDKIGIVICEEPGNYEVQKPADFVVTTPTVRFSMKLDLAPWDQVIVDELPRNNYCSSYLAEGWWKRDPDMIRAVCFHHTRSNDPYSLAKWYVFEKPWTEKIEGKEIVHIGRPSLPYTVWITQTGEILLCNDLEEACWHNHNGHRNLELSVGLAGDLSRFKPTDVQLDAAAKVACWGIFSLPRVKDIGSIKGHMDYFAGTECPGWSSERSGYWKRRLFNKIECLLRLV